MKLIVRSQYWGTVLRGKPRVDAANPSRSFRTISSQAVLTIEGKYWGCCQGQGKRVLELTEQHFVDAYPGDWDLYLVGSSPTESEAIHTFFVLPQRQNSVDVQFHLCYSGWLYYGTVSATSIRRQLRELLSDVFKPNETIGFRYHHVHIEILMSQVTDHAARAKKANNNNGKQEKPNEGKDKTAPAAGETSKSPTPVPPAVAKSASNDASATTEVTSSPSTTASYYEAAQQHDQHHVPQFVRSGSFDADMICYPVPMPHQYQLVGAMPAHSAPPHAHVVASAAMYHPPPPQHYHDHRQQQQYHAHAAAPPPTYPVLNPVPVGCFVPLNAGFVPPPSAGLAAAHPTNGGGRVPPRAAADPVVAREDGAPPPTAAAAPHDQPPSQEEEEASAEDGPQPPPPQTQ